MDHNSYKVVKSVFDYNQVLNCSVIDSIETFKVEAGRLMLPSGKIVIGDPFTIWDRSPLERRVAPGEYPVTLICIKHPTAGKRVAFAQLTFNENAATHWEMALTGEEDIDSLREDEFYGFPVDAGLACFVDEEICKAFNEKMNALYEEDKDHNYYDDVLAEEFKHNAFDKSDPQDVGAWVNHRFNKEGNENIVIFSSGCGDGIYPAYWGIDKDNSIASIIIDFMIVDLN